MTRGEEVDGSRFCPQIRRLSVGDAAASAASKAWGSIMIIALDYDGTIADTNREKAAWIKANLGKTVAPWDCNRTACVPLIGEEAYLAMGNYVYEREGTLEAREVPGAVASIRALARAGQVYVVTVRPPRRIEFAREWLSRNDVLSNIEGMISSQGTSKGKICSQLGAEVLIDDDVRHLRGANLPALRRVLLQHGRGDDIELEPCVDVCRNWEDILKLLGCVG